jgi:LPXTG-motif cell wall-anchored protein
LKDKPPVMKKLLFQALLLLTSSAIFAQNEEQHSAEYNWGEKNAIYVIIGLVVLIVVIFVWIRNRKKKTP